MSTKVKPTLIKTVAEARDQAGRRVPTGRGTCRECPGIFQLTAVRHLLGSPDPGIVRAHKKPGQPDRSRQCIGSNEPPSAVEERWSSIRQTVLVKVEGLYDE